jgi:hypothetical protein
MPDRDPTILMLLNIAKWRTLITMNCSNQHMDQIKPKWNCVCWLITNLLFRQNAIYYTKHLQF